MEQTNIYILAKTLISRVQTHLRSSISNQQHAKSSLCCISERSLTIENEEQREQLSATYQSERETLAALSQRNEQ
jgi:hypothetical protein